MPRLQENRHHLWYCKSDYQRGVFKELRQHPDLIVMMRVPQHNGLHRAVAPPPRPPVDVAYDFLEDLNKHPTESKIEGIEFSENWFATRAIFNTCNDAETELLLGIAHNLAEQLRWIRSDGGTYGEAQIHG